MATAVGTQQATQSVTRLTGAGVATGSIFDRLKSVDNQGAGQTQATGPSLNEIYGAKAESDKAVDYNQLITAWGDFASRLQTADSHLRSVMAHPPRLEGEVIVVDVANAMQGEIANRVDLVTFLRQRLSNSRLSIRANLVAKTDAPIVPYTAKQKLDAMLSENAELEKLITKFGLTFD